MVVLRILLGHIQWVLFQKRRDIYYKLPRNPCIRASNKKRIGNRLGDNGHAIQRFVETKGLSVVRDFCGHGIGPSLHEEPQVAHFGSPGKGLRLIEGMVTHG